MIGKLLNFREANTRVLAVGTPPPVTATLSFLSVDDEPLQKASIGDAIQMVVTSEQAGPHNMMLTECTATRVGGEGDIVPFTIIENGLVQHFEANSSIMISEKGNSVLQIFVFFHECQWCTILV